MTTTVAPSALEVFNARRAQARAEREAARREVFARIRAIDHEARESIHNPKKHAPIKAPTTPNAAKKSPGRPVNRDILKPCAGGCGRTTHPRDHPTKDYPNTIVRRLKAGKCSTCITGGRKPRRGITPATIRPCATCGRPTRTSGVPITEAPGTVTRRRGGMCTPCARKADLE